MPEHQVQEQSNSVSVSLRHNENDNEAGVAYVELLLVIFPFVLSVIFATFECGNLLQIKQNIVFVTREAGLYAHRECSPYQDRPSMDACIDFIQNRMESMARQFVHGNAEVMLSIYEREAGVPTQISVAPTAAGLGGLISRFNVKLIDEADADLTLMLDQQGRITVAEINTIYTPLFTRNFWFFNFTDIDYYETAIY